MNCKRMAQNGVALLISIVFVCVICGSCAAGDSIYHYASGCPQEEQDCEYSWSECVDWDSSLLCTIPTALACEGFCFVVGSVYLGWACRLGCPVIAYELCKYCEDFDLHYYCECSGGDPIELVVNPLPEDEDKPGKGKGRSAE